MLFSGACASTIFSSNSLDLSAPEEACSKNVRASGTLKFEYEGVFKIQIICKFLDALIGNKGAVMFTGISHCKSMGIFDCHAIRGLVQTSKLRTYLSSCFQIIFK